LHDAGPELVGRAISANGQLVLVQSTLFGHLYLIQLQQDTAAQLEPPLPQDYVSGIGIADMSANGAVVFRHGGGHVPATPQAPPIDRIYLRSAGGQTEILEEFTSASDLLWNGPIALSGDGRLVFHQLITRSGTPPLSDHPTVAQPLVARDTASHQLARDPTTGEVEVIDANFDGVALPCGLQGVPRLTSNADGRVVAFALSEGLDTNEAVPWDRNTLPDVYIIDRSAPVRGQIHARPC